MGGWLRGASCVPTRVLCSTARRARETWQLAQPALTVAPPVAFDQGIYEGTAAELLALVRRIPAETGTVLLLGHAPAIQDLAVMLVAASSCRAGANAAHPGAGRTSRVPRPAPGIAAGNRSMPGGLGAGPHGGPPRTAGVGR